MLSVLKLLKRLFSTALLYGRILISYLAILNMKRLYSTALLYLRYSYQLFGNFEDETFVFSYLANLNMKRLYSPALCYIEGL